MKSISARITYANVVATLALFVALGGASYAAIKLPKNSVGTKQLRKGAVTKEKISGAARKALVGQTGPAGPAGPAGAPGAPGSALGYASIDLEGHLVPAQSKGVAGVSGLCGPGESQCTSPTPPGDITHLCFDLEFTPHVLVATPAFRRPYAPDEATVVNASVPAHPWSQTYSGCPVGYEDAELRASREDAFEVTAGIYVMFN